VNYSAVVDIVEMLIRHGADVNVRDVTGKTVLCRAVEIVCTDESASSHSRLIELLLQNGADVNAVSADNTLPTYSPCVIENTLLIAYGAQPSAYRAKLQRVVYHRRLQCTDLEGKNISSEDQAKEILLSADQVSLYQSPLCIATENENARVVDILLRYKADVNLRDATGRAALHYACENNDSELVKQLLMAGADPNLPTELTFSYRST
jgi:ankyrin repeat protein